MRDKASDKETEDTKTSEVEDEEEPLDSLTLRKYQNDAIKELFSALPNANSLTRASPWTVLRLATSLLRMKHQMNLTLPPDQIRCEPLVEDYLKSLDGFCLLLTRKLKVFYVSESVCVSLGYSQTQMTRNKLYSFVHEDDILNLFNVLDQFKNMNSEEVPLKVSLRMKYKLNKHTCGFTMDKYIMKGYKTCHFTGFLNKQINKKYPVFFLYGTVVDPLIHIRVPLGDETFLLRISNEFKMKFVDNSVEKLLYYTPTSLINASLYQFIHLEDLPYLVCLHKEILSPLRDQSISPIIRILRFGGGVAYCILHALKLPINKQNKSITIIVTILGRSPEKMIESIVQKDMNGLKKTDNILRSEYGLFATDFLKSKVDNNKEKSAKSIIGQKRKKQAKY